MYVVDRYSTQAGLIKGKGGVGLVVGLGKGVAYLYGEHCQLVDFFLLRVWLALGGLWGGGGG